MKEHDDMKKQQKRNTLQALGAEKLKEVLGRTEDPIPPQNPDARAVIIDFG